MFQSDRARELTYAAITMVAARLDPIISRVLAPHLEGLHWTNLLVAVDMSRGKEKREIAAHDPQSHLRIITERLGVLGYPFDDHNRVVTTLGSELRIMRNQVAHNYPLTEIDAWRTADYGVRLLTRLGDTEGAAQLQTHRDSILRLTPPDASAGARDASIQVDSAAETTALEENRAPAAVSPDAETLAAPETAGERVKIGLINDSRPTYEEWTPVKTGEKDVLDNLKARGNAEKVRTVIEEIVEFEGPVHLDRVITLAGRAFDFGRLEKSRRRQLQHQAKQADVSLIGDWAWPTSMDPETWTGFRPNDSDADRDFEQIAPQEVRNAAMFAKQHHPEETDEQIHRRVLQTFGRNRMTKGVRTHLVSCLS